MIGPERRGDVIEAGVAYLAPHAARVHEDPEPEAEHIPTFLFVIPGDHPWTDRRIMKVREPEWQRSWGYCQLKLILGSSMKSPKTATRFPDSAAKISCARSAFTRSSPSAFQTWMRVM